jgi:hypothetical protein
VGLREFALEHIFAMLLLLACAVGIYLGLNFSVLVLLALSFLGAVAFTLSCWSGTGFSDGFRDVLVPVFSAQAGYMLGLTARDTYGHLLTRLNIAQSKRI